MENKTEFKKELGLLNATSLVAGSMIGSGIFIVTSIMARDIGGAGWILLAWILKHPSKIHPVIGTVIKDRIKANTIDDNPYEPIADPARSADTLKAAVSSSYFCFSTSTSIR